MKNQTVRKRKPGLGDVVVAIGELIGFYRRRQKVSQDWLRKKARLTLSALAMFEAGKRLPTLDAISKMSAALGLSPFQKRQLEILAESPRNQSVAGHEWFLADDVIHGTPLFLRDVTRESNFQRVADIQEMWIVTHKPLAANGEMYTMLSDRIFSRKTSFVYFIDSTAGEAPIRALWSTLLAEPRHRRADITSCLKCVLTPGSFCLYHFAICNPSDDFGKMFGRLIIYAGGVPVGFTGMDPNQVSRAYDLLKPRLQQCLIEPGKGITTDYGTFRLIEPEREPFM